MDDFKLQFYFNLLKDNPSRSRYYFKTMFDAKYGKFDKIKDLISMIEKYQIKKYGTMLYKQDLSQEELDLLRKVNAKRYADEINCLKGWCRKNK